MTASQTAGHPDPAGHADAAEAAAWERRVHRDASTDRAARVGVWVLVGVGLLLAFLWEAGSEPAGIGALCIAGLWIYLTLRGARAARALARITPLMARDPAAAQREAEAALRLGPMPVWVRLALYHRLASIARRGGRGDVAAAICRAVLSYPLGPVERLRSAMLIMLIDASLAAGDLWQAWAGLNALAALPRLTVPHRHQQLVLTLRYQRAAGQSRAMLHDLSRKTAFADTMPHPLSGMTHAWLAEAAAELMLVRDLLAHL